MTARRDLLELLRRREPRTTEELALKLLALRREPANPEPLIGWQRSDGAWSAFPSAGPPNVFHTALALIALRHLCCQGGHVGPAFDWLESVTGNEGHWFWKWKFRFFDRQVRFDSAKSGWPWVPGTVGWVAPTSMALLALRAWKRKSPRAESARAMLIDRACPGGGWNAGNGVAFRVPLDPHPDFTAMALLALRGGGGAHYHQVIERGHAYLGKRAKESKSVYTLAWSAMALASPVDGLLRIAVHAQTLPVHVHALVALALEDPPFGFSESAP